MYIEVYCDRRSEYRWRMVAENGRKVADSGEGYSSKAHALRAAKHFRNNLKHIKIVGA